MRAALVVMPTGRRDRTAETVTKPAALFVAGGRDFRPVTLAKVQACAAASAMQENEVPRPELAFYRKYTEAMLRRYQTLSMEGGRVPSLLGREMFHGKVTSYKVRGFDDVVIYCHDVGRCLEQLDGVDQRLIKRVALQQYTLGEAAGLIGVCLRTAARRYNTALDRVTALFLERGLLDPLAGVTRR